LREVIVLSHDVFRKEFMTGKIAILDIETTSLAADSGIIVGIGLMPENGPAEYLGVRTTGQEKQALSKLITRLGQYEVLVTWNGRGFDFPFLITRLLSHGLDPRPLASKRHVDLNEVVKGRLRLTFNYLEHVCDFFGIQKKRGPMGMDVPHLYLKAQEGDAGALRVIREHRLDDLDATRKVFLKLKPLLEGFI
jgi:uncharacterized protein